MEGAQGGCTWPKGGRLPVKGWKDERYQAHLRDRVTLAHKIRIAFLFSFQVLYFPQAVCHFLVFLILSRNYF